MSLSKPGCRLALHRGLPGISDKPRIVSYLRCRLSTTWVKMGPPHVRSMLDFPSLSTRVCTVMYFAPGPAGTSDSTAYGESVRYVDLLSCTESLDLTSMMAMTIPP